MSMSELLYRCFKNRWERATAAVAVAVGSLALLLGWLGISRATLTTEQLPYIASGGLLGLFALGMAATLWLSADMRDEHQTLLGIKQLMADSVAEAASRPVPSVKLEDRQLGPLATSTGNQR